MDLQVNRYQTPLTEELLETLPQEAVDLLLDSINNVQFIRNLISPDRKFAGDLPRDDKGRIIVDLINPHIIEDMEYFRPTGNHYRKYGVLTSLRPNANPNSDFGVWIREEVQRIWYGMIRESDGEWVTGDMYFYLNYVPIIQSKIRKGTKQADRIIDFPEVWESVYLWFHYVDQARNGGMYNDFQGGQHCVHIARRGASKSYTSAAMLAKLFIVGESVMSKESVRGLVTAYQKEYLTKDGILNKFLDVIDFCADHTQFPSKRVKSSIQEMTWKMGYLDAVTGVARGTGNEVIGVSSKDNSDKIRGKRANKIIFEEFGAFMNFIDVWNTTIPSVQEGDIAFGQMISIGTGGSKGSDFSGALEIIYNPKGYNVYGLPNVYDRNTQGKSFTVFFTGGYMCRKGYYNEDGVSDVTGALISIIKDYLNVKYNSSDPIALTQRKAEIPITIQDSIMKVEQTIYPIADITDVINALDSDPKSFDDVYVGELAIRDNNVEFKPTLEHKPVRDFPHKDNKVPGAVEIFKHPEYDRSGKVYPNRYIAGIDVFDDDASNTMSLGAIKILDLMTDQIVAQYTGRRMFADEFYEICRRLLIYYNARGNYENNKKGLFAYFSRMNSTYLLTDTLEFLKDKDMVKGELYGNKVKGSPSTAPIKAYYRKCIRDWLLKPVTKIEEVDGQEVEVSVPQLVYSKQRALLKELTLWNPDGNFDEHDALGMLMLLREDRLRLMGDRSFEQTMSSNRKDYLGDDPFFSDSYSSRMEKINRMIGQENSKFNNFEY